MPHTGKSGDYKSTPGHKREKDGAGGIHASRNRKAFVKGAIKRALPNSISTQGSTAGSGVRNTFRGLGASVSSAASNTDSSIGERRQKIQALVNQNRKTRTTRPDRTSGSLRLQGTPHSTV